MRKRLENLTDEQLARLPDIRDEWIQIGLSCEPLDLEEAKRGAILAYEAAGLAPPTKFYVAGGPIEAALMASYLKNVGPLGDTTMAELLERFRGE